MVEKGVGSGIWHAFHQYAKPSNKFPKDYNRNNESLYLTYWNVNNSYR